jgi:hypothetical protein
MGTLGHGQGKYQPTPKPIEGVKGAVKVACGVDHTIVLIGASIPPIPHLESSLALNLHTSSDTTDESPVVSTPRPLLSLKELCEQKIAQSVHLQNVISILNFASYYSCHGLYSFALQFILRFPPLHTPPTSRSPHPSLARNLDIVLIQLFNSTAAVSTKAGRETIWSELDVVVNEIEESVSLHCCLPSQSSSQSHGGIEVEHSKLKGPSKLPAHSSPQLPSPLKLLEDLPTELSSCKKLIKNLRKYLTTASEPER